MRPVKLNNAQSHLLPHDARPVPHGGRRHGLAPAPLPGGSTAHARRSWPVEEREEHMPYMGQGVASPMIAAPKSTSGAPSQGY